MKLVIKLYSINIKTLSKLKTPYEEFWKRICINKFLAIKQMQANANNANY